MKSLRLLFIELPRENIGLFLIFFAVALFLVLLVGLLVYAAAAAASFPATLVYAVLALIMVCLSGAVAAAVLEL
jgi:hypothetical protein